MHILVNEREVEIPEDSTTGEVADTFKPGADLLIVNGFPAAPGHKLSAGDRLVLIRRGESPSPEEMESLLVARHTPGIHEKVRSARVGVAGLGGLGSHAALALARLGVGELVLADFDVVEPSNLNRQCYFVRQIGLPKTEALAATIREANPYVRLRLHAVRIVPSSVRKIFAGCDVLLEAFDGAEEKAMLVETALADLPETSVVAASGLAGYGPGEEIGVRRLGPRLHVVGDLVSEARPFQGLMAPRVGVAAHLQANVALRILLGEEDEPGVRRRRSSSEEN